MAKHDWITKDPTWKALSLILAIVLWITVHNIRETPEDVPFATKNTTTFTNLPVLAVSGGADVRNARIVPDQVTVKVSGPDDIIAGLQKSQIRASVNLTSIDSAQGLHLNVDVSMPPGVALDKIDPLYVSVTISPPTNGPP